MEEWKSFIQLDYAGMMRSEKNPMAISEEDNVLFNRK